MMHYKVSVHCYNVLRQTSRSAEVRDARRSRLRAELTELTKLGAEAAASPATSRAAEAALGLRLRLASLGAEFRQLVLGQAAPWLQPGRVLEFRQLACADRGGGAVWGVLLTARLPPPDEHTWGLGEPEPIAERDAEGGAEGSGSGEEVAH